jgi:hypothetical protein
MDTGTLTLSSFWQLAEVEPLIRVMFFRYNWLLQVIITDISQADASLNIIARSLPVSLLLQALRSCREEAPLAE